MEPIIVVLAFLFAAIAIGLGVHTLCTLLTGRAKRATDQHSNMMRAIALKTRDGIIIQDTKARIIWANPSYCAMTGYELDELVGKNPLEFLVLEDERPSKAELDAFEYDMSSEFLDAYEVRQNVRKNGELFWNALSFSVYSDEAGTDKRVIVSCRDVTERVEQEEAIRKSNEVIAYRAEHDPLTSTANRVKLEKFFAETLEVARAENQKFGLLHIDLDRFKNVNDTFGHSAGDAVIVASAERMTTSIRENDLLARIGGDEFVVICPNIESYSTMQTISERIIEAVKQPVLWEDNQLVVGASIGGAMSNSQISGYDDLIKNADLALYEAKKLGRGRFAYYDDAMDRSYFNRTKLSNRLHGAFENDEFEIMLQPQYSMLGKSVTGFEALIRWRHPSKGLILPGGFLEIAKETGKIVEIDRIAVSKALEALKAVDEAGFHGLHVSVNASAETINQGGYTDFLLWEADRVDLAAERLGVEVLETTFFRENDDTAARTISNLSAAGFRVELDDFGTGYAGLAHLGRLRLDGIKIDRSMITGLSSNPANQTIVKATVELCRDLGLGVIAEGVQTPEQARILRSHGCINAQGNGVSPPMTVEETIQWLQVTNFDEVLAASKVAAA